MEKKIDVLLIEDNANDAELTTLALKKGGLDLNILILNDGAKALEILDPSSEISQQQLSTSLKLILLDLKMPKVNGFEVLKSFRSHDKWRTVPIVILTSSAVESDIAAAYEFGANSYIVKPIEYSMHANAITEAVRYWTTINKTLN